MPVPQRLLARRRRRRRRKKRRRRGKKRRRTRWKMKRWRRSPCVAAEEGHERGRGVRHRPRVRLSSKQLSSKLHLS